MEPLIEASALEKSFLQGDGGRLRVLRNINLTVCQGECVAIVGPSGAGKSTLLHLLGALDKPTGGRVLFKKTDLFRQSDQELARFRNKNIGFVFQFHHLLPEFTALENVAIPNLISGKDKKRAFLKAESLLEAMGLSQRTTHRPGELSGGEQQRVAIARALATDPAMLLADEPTGNLDRNTGATVHNLLLELNRSQGITLIIVTHNMELAKSMDRTITLIDGCATKDERTAV